MHHLNHVKRFHQHFIKIKGIDFVFTYFWWEYQFFFYFTYAVSYLKPISVFSPPPLITRTLIWKLNYVNFNKILNWPSWEGRKAGTLSKNFFSFWLLLPHLKFILTTAAITSATPSPPLPRPPSQSPSKHVSFKGRNVIIIIDKVLSFNK
mgnify:CR=1 FL=1